MTEVRNVVLVHGGFVDGAGWEGVYNILKKNGFDVRIVQNPTVSLADDVAVTRRAIGAQSGASRRGACRSAHGARAWSPTPGDRTLCVQRPESIPWSES